LAIDEPLHDLTGLALEPRSIGLWQVSSQGSQGFTVIECRDSLAQRSGASGSGQVRFDALLEFRFELRGNLAPERGQLRVGCYSGLQVEPISQRERAVLVLPQPFQNVQCTPPAQGLAPGPELVEQLPVSSRIRRTEVDGRIKVDDGSVVVACFLVVLRRGKQPIDRSVQGNV
jgi:hypothetical protein